MMLSLVFFRDIVLAIRDDREVNNANKFLPKGFPRGGRQILSDFHFCRR